MENYIIIGIVAVALIIGVIFTVRHFGRKGGCCGGGSYKPKTKKLTTMLYKKVFKIDGMHCECCKRRVEEIINDIKGVAGKVNLKKGELTVYYAEEVDDEVIISRIERAGYNVVR